VLLGLGARSGAVFLAAGALALLALAWLALRAATGQATTSEGASKGAAAGR
jgi:hypothetical protein